MRILYTTVYDMSIPLVKFILEKSGSDKKEKGGKLKSRATLRVTRIILTAIYSIKNQITL